MALGPTPAEPDCECKSLILVNNRFVSEAFTKGRDDVRIKRLQAGSAPEWKLLAAESKECPMNSQHIALVPVVDET
jgi:hypothetical protein